VCRVWNEPCRRRFHFDAFQRGFGADAFLLQGDEALDRPGVRAHFAHGVQVQFEMAAIARSRPIIRLFAQDDFVDQASRMWVGRRQPGQMHAGQFPLQALGQGHEVPHGEYVAFHKPAQQIN